MAARLSGSATARLKQEYMRLMKDPPPFAVAVPLPSNILEWHYVVEGPTGTPYAGGYYHGKLIFPREFPFKPPAIYILTPNGRFKTNVRLCLSISDYHPDTWNPAWCVSTILTGLLSFMVEKTPTLGSIETPDYEKRQLALKSLSYNLNNKLFTELFPEITEKIKEQLANQTSNPPKPAVQVTTTNDQSVSAIWNLILIIGFAAFAYTVKYVMTTSTDDL